MKKKIIFILSFIILLLCFNNSSAATLDENYYQSQIDNIQKEIDDIQKEIDKIELEIKQLNSDYNQLQTECANKLSYEQMVDWFNSCNKYGVRANVRIYTKYYNTFLGIETSSKTISGNGVIFRDSDTTYYALTTTLITAKNDDYKKTKYSILDAFGSKYDATLVDHDEEYGLSILSFKSTNSYLNTIDLGDSAVSIEDPVCQVYTSIDGGYNHMYFTNVESIKSTSSFAFNLFWTDVDLNQNIAGCMLLDLNGNLVGISSGTYTNLDGSRTSANIPLTNINSYLKNLGYI